MCVRVLCCPAKGPPVAGSIGDVPLRPMLDQNFSPVCCVSQYLVWMYLVKLLISLKGSASSTAKD